MASLFYDVKHNVNFWQPAVLRQRQLAAAAFGYAFDGPPDFGLDALTRGVATQPYAVIMPSASRTDKLWPAEAWHRVFDRLGEHGLSLSLLAGNPEESARAQALVRDYPGAQVMPRMSLRDVAGLLAACTLMVGLDSGLTHLSAGLGRPTIGIYKASTPVRTPLEGVSYTASLGDRGNAPSAETVLSAIEQALAYQPRNAGGADSVAPDLAR
jgi:heptosyltransferase-1